MRTGAVPHEGRALLSQAWRTEASRQSQVRITAQGGKVTRVRVLCVVLLVVGCAFAQRWVTPAETTSFRFTRFDGEYFPGTGKVYFLGGRLSDGSTNGTIWSYDPATRAYANTGVTMAIPVSNYDICLVRDMWNPPTDSYGLYVIGGRQGSTGYSTDTVHVYYPMSNTVRKLTTDQYPGRVNTYIPAALGAVVAGNKIYVQGGFNSQDYAPSNLAYVFDPLASAGARWTQLPNLNSARGYTAGATIDDTLVYVIGGDSSYPSTLVPLPRVERLNTMNTGAGWTRVRDMQMACGETRAFAFQRGDSVLGFSRQIVVAGTGQWPNESAYCRIYKVATDSWYTFPALDSARRNHAGAYIPGTAGTNGVPGIWVWGGRKGSDAYLLKTPEYYALGLNVGVTKIEAPTGSVDSGAVVTPACSVYNYGVTSATYDVAMRIAGFDAGVVTVTDHAPGTRVYVTFPDWTAVWPRGTYPTACSTRYAGDLDRSNDKQTGTVTIDVHDVGTKVLLAPSGTIAAGTVVTPACSVFNLGSVSETYNVRLKIGSVYDQISPVAGHAAGATRYVTFPNWTATVGTHAVSCSTELAADSYKANDKQTGSVVVSPVGTPGWNLKSQMPSGSKPIKDGGWLAYDDGTGLIYASRGNKQPNFFSYNPVKDSWKALAPWLPGTEGKMPSKGSAGCADGNGVIYATKGSNKSGFWKYDAATNVWTQLKDVPLGPTNKKVKGGTDMVFVQGKHDTGYAYLLKGYKNEFYRYHVIGDSWQTLEPAPIGGNPKWDKGSWIVAQKEPGPPPKPYTIYAHKAKFHEFYSYSTETGIWNATALLGMPIAGSSGSKKSKDGGCAAFLDDSIYAFKGGNTLEFWKYSVTTNSWVEKEQIPVGSFKKKVKAGAGMVAVGGFVYATKGNKDNSLWMYLPSSFASEPPAPQRDGVLAGKTEIAQGMSISPNPLASGFAVLRYGLPKAGAARLSVYNMAGQTVMTRTLAAGRNGNVNLDLRHLSNGVYLVKLSSDGFENSQKLVFER